MRGSKLMMVACMVLAPLLALLLPASALASNLIAPGVGAPEGGMMGANVARPVSPAYAVSVNPAALVNYERRTEGFTFAVATGRTEVNSPAVGYSDKSDFAALSPDYGLALGGDGPWSYGFAMAGSVGASNNFDPIPAFGPEKFYAESSILRMGPAMARRLRDDLSVGFAITPLLAYLRAHYPTPLGPTRYVMRGTGIQANGSVAWQPREGWDLAVGLRTPGMIWLDGSAPSPSGRQDLDLQLQMPAQAYLGSSWSLGERAVLHSAIRWTGADSFGRSKIHFAETPQLDAPFVPGGTDEWRYAFGGSYRVSERWELRTGVGYANPIVKDRGVSPLLMDVSDWKIGVGAGLYLENLRVDFVFGYGVPDDRNIDASEALIIPGVYRMGGNFMGVGLEWEG